MTATIRDIPPGPRRPRGIACIVRFWPMALGGGVLTVFGGLVTLMLWFNSIGGYSAVDAELDARGIPAEGVVLSVVPQPETVFRAAQERVEYRFLSPDGPLKDVSFAPHGSYEIGDIVQLEYVPQQPFRSRLAAGRITVIHGYVGTSLLLTVVPGMALLLAWAAAAWQTRQLLRVGDVSLAQPVHVRLVPLVVPSMLLVRFHFRDRHARVREGEHWVRIHSGVGRRVLAGERRLAVVHDRERPWRLRLAAPEDFVQNGPSHAPTRRALIPFRRRS